MKFNSYFLLCLAAIAKIASCKDAPEINPNFMVSTVEVDETNTTILEQKLVFDIDLRRNMMYAEGSLVKGAMQQIKRCDIHPNGWMSSSGGPNINAPSTWSCTNITIDRVSEMPQNCQYSSFWSFPDMKYAGEDFVNGIACDKWVYLSGPAEEYAVWTTTASVGDGSDEVYDVPVANGKIRSNSSSLWTIFYYDFVPGSADDSAYAAVEGCVCPASTPP